MTNSKELFNDLASRIHLEEARDEIHSIIYELLHHVLELTRTDIASEKEIEISNPSMWSEIISRINQHEPIQYILKESIFYGRNFSVNSSVLIPRPETELIIREVITYDRSTNAHGTMLDIGTGSGCLAVTLAKEFPGREVVATDISEAALQVAASNAHRHQVSVKFLLNDILTDPLPSIRVDTIVSNPPYVTPGEKTFMDKNVLLYEPAIALFVPDDNPFVFYDAIARQAKKILSPSGKVFTEINEKFGQEVVAIFRKEGFQDVIIQKDLEGKDRMILASR